jgi:hypothetical protein
MFTVLGLSFFGISGGGEFTIAPSMDGERCTETLVTVVPNEWVDLEIPLAEVCSAGRLINGITFSNSSEKFTFVLDEVFFR